MKPPLSPSFLLGLFAALLLAPVRAAEPSRPNIVFIYADDLGWGDVGCHAAEDWIKTPRIDRLAAEGVDFAQFNVLSPVCSPSRIAAMTGRFPSRYGVNNVFNGQTLGPKKTGAMPDWLDPEAPMLPRILKAAGYRTLHFGKWHMGADQRLAPDAPPMSSYGIEESKVYHGPGPSIGLHDIGVEAAAAIGRLKGGPPFYMNVWLHESHTMHIPSQEALDAFKHLDPRRQVYAAVLREADLNVGRIMDALRETGMDRNTIVIFSSDNGPAGHPVAAGDRIVQSTDGNAKKGFDIFYSVGSTGGLRGRKGNLFEGGVRVPFIVRWPSRVPAGVNDQQTVLSAVDLLPTLCAAAEAPIPSDYKGDGENLLPALLGNPVARTKPLFWKHYHVSKGDDTWAAWSMREDRWKLLTDLSGDRCALYDLVNDRAEASDASATNPDVVARMKPQLMEWIKSLPTAADPRCVHHP
jgi:arylsulfatase A-like enzyme